MSLNVRSLTAENYRSLRSLHLPVERLSVFVGANGVGKTNLYRALQLLQGAAAGTLALDLAAEGGMDSAYWAGERRRGKPVQIRLGVGLGTGAMGGPSDFSYEVAIGFPLLAAPGVSATAAFPLEPQVKEELALYHRGPRRTKLLERHGPHLVARDEDGERVDFDADLMASETALGRLADPSRFPDLQMIRQTLADWRFYHDLRTDAGSPLRQPSLAAAAATLASDGSNLAAVFATLAHIRQDTFLLDQAVADAFPGARLEIPMPGRTATFGMVMPDYPKRVFEPFELSDGTLRFLGLAGALLAYRPPAFIALNEPEASLHPHLMEPLARMIVTASERTQVWVVTHSQTLAAAIERFGNVRPRSVIKADGATTIKGLKLGGFEEE